MTDKLKPLEETEVLLAQLAQKEEVMEIQAEEIVELRAQLAEKDKLLKTVLKRIDHFGGAWRILAVKIREALKEKSND